MKFKQSELKEFLDENVDKYNRNDFIESDPISSPHRFTGKEDIEISGFSAGTIVWGNRTMILRNAGRMMSLMDGSPYEFILNHGDNDLERIKSVIHRTFNSTDFIYFIKALKHIYTKYDGMERIFNMYSAGDSLHPSIHQFRNLFLNCHMIKEQGNIFQTCTEDQRQRN